MLRAPDKPPRKYPHVYAIVRFDLFVDRNSVEHSATVVKVLPSRDLAEQEAARLRRLNKGIYLRRPNYKGSSGHSE